MKCGLPSTAVTLNIGNNIETTCTFNFDYVAQKISTNTYKNYVYELLLADDSGSFFQVPVYFIGGTNPNTPYRRFFVEDTYSDSASMTVLKQMKFMITL